MRKPKPSAPASNAAPSKRPQKTQDLGSPKKRLKKDVDDNPFAGKAKENNIFHLRSDQVGPEIFRKGSYDECTEDKIHEFIAKHKLPPVFGRPIDIVLAGITFQIRGFSGFGSFGQVYCANIKGKPNTRYALKVLCHKHNKRKQRRYTPDRELQVVANLDRRIFEKSTTHPHLISILAFAPHAQLRGVFQQPMTCGLIVMEYAPFPVFNAIVKTDASGKKRPNPLSSRFTRHLIRQAIFGLERLLCFGISHRDLKPQNMLFDKDCNLVLCDLGSAKDLARGLSPEERERTLHSMRVLTVGIGTKKFLPPEVIKAHEAGLAKMKSDVKKLDVWAIGVTMFQLRSCICPMDPADTLMHSGFDDLDPAPHDHDPTAFNVDADHTNARMWARWDAFRAKIAPHGPWHHSEYCRHYINEQFGAAERAFLNLLLQKDPRCRATIRQLAQAARGHMQGIPKALAWIAADDVPLADEFQAEMAKRISDFGFNTRTGPLRRELFLGPSAGKTNAQMVQVMLDHLKRQGEFAVTVRAPPGVDYIVQVQMTDPKMLSSVKPPPAAAAPASSSLTLSPPQQPPTPPLTFTQPPNLPSATLAGAKAPPTPQALLSPFGSDPLPAIDLPPMLALPEAQVEEAFAYSYRPVGPTDADAVMTFSSVHDRRTSITCMVYVHKNGTVVCKFNKGHSMDTIQLMRFSAQFDSAFDADSSPATPPAHLFAPRLLQPASNTPKEYKEIPSIDSEMGENNDR